MSIQIRDMQDWNLMDIRTGRKQRFVLSKSYLSKEILKITKKRVFKDF
jgi:hypothetical protein